MAYLLVILFVGTFATLSEGIIASVAAMLPFNYFFLPPIGKFTISDPQNWIALFAFLTVALVSSKLSTNFRRQQDKADDEPARNRTAVCLKPIDVAGRLGRRSQAAHCQQSD